MIRRCFGSKCRTPTPSPSPKKPTPKRRVNLPMNMMREILLKSSGPGVRKLRRQLGLRKPVAEPNRKISKVSRLTSVRAPNGPNITYAYKNKNWKYYVPGKGTDVLFFDENKTKPFKILKNGRRKYVSKNYFEAIIPFGGPRITQNKFKPRIPVNEYKRKQIGYMTKLNSINNNAYRQRNLNRWSNENLIAYIQGHWRPVRFFTGEEEYEKRNNGKWYVGNSELTRNRILYNINAAHGRA